MYGDGLGNEGLWRLSYLWNMATSGRPFPYPANSPLLKGESIEQRASDAHGT